MFLIASAAKQTEEEMGSGSMIASIILSSSKAMMKLLVISIVGILAAKYPRNDPILPPGALKHMSRLSNIVLLPCLIIKSLGGTINFSLLLRIGILTLFCFMINSISFLICDVIGYRIHGEENGDRNSELFIAIKVAVGNGNAIGLPILVMQILCQDNLINADFNHDSDKCYEEASSMIFVYMIVWFIMFWGYSFPTLQRLKQREILGDGGESHSANIPANKVISSGGAVQQPKTVSDFMGRFADSQFYLSAKKVIVSPAIIAVMVALFIGLIPALQYQFFSSDGGLYVIGSAMDTVGEPVVALNTLIMAASLAQCDFPVHKVQQYVDRFLFNDTSAHDSLVRKPMLAPEPRVGEFGGIEEPDTPVDNMSEDIETDIVQPYSAFPVSSDEDVALPGEIPEKGLVSPSSATPAKELPPLRSVLALIICR